MLQGLGILQWDGNSEPSILGQSSTEGPRDPDGDNDNSERSDRKRENMNDRERHRKHTNTSVEKNFHQEESASYSPKAQESN